MERLTEYLGGIPHIKRTINGINGKANYLRDFDIEAVRKLAAYEDLEEQGRLIVLPCKVGDTVFTVGSSKVIPCVWVIEHILWRDGRLMFTAKHNRLGKLLNFTGDEIGKTVFLARAEAEAAMKGVSEDGK